MMLFCSQKVAEDIPKFQNDLFNLAFAACWHVFNDQRKGQIIKNIEKAINVIRRRISRT
jgi:hypothetical protein